MSTIDNDFFDTFTVISAPTSDELPFDEPILDKPTSDVNLSDVTISENINWDSSFIPHISVNKINVDDYKISVSSDKTLELFSATVNKNDYDYDFVSWDELQKLFMYGLEKKCVENIKHETNISTNENTLRITLNLTMNSSTYKMNFKQIQFILKKDELDDIHKSKIINNHFTKSSAKKDDVRVFRKINSIPDVKNFIDIKKFIDKSDTLTNYIYKIDENTNKLKNSYIKPTVDLDFKKDDKLYTDPIIDLDNGDKIITFKCTGSNMFETEEINKHNKFLINFLNKWNYMLKSNEYMSYIECGRHNGIVSFSNPKECHNCNQFDKIINADNMINILLKYVISHYDIKYINFPHFTSLTQCYHCVMVVNDKSINQNRSIKILNIPNQSMVKKFKIIQILSFYHMLVDEIKS